jgi:Predicted nucleic acid-binding protein, contains PIN domain
MILVDTSVLISFFKGKETEKTNKFQQIIQSDIPFGINDFIYQEILQGSRTDKEFNLLKDYLQSQKFYSLKLGNKSYENAARMFFQCRKNGITIRSTIDLLIAEMAIENKLFLLHEDRDFSNMAKVIIDLKEY